MIKRSRTIFAALLTAVLLLAGGEWPTGTTGETLPVSVSGTSRISREKPEKTTPPVSPLSVVEVSSSVPENRVDPSFLDDAVFIGDSVTLKLKYYVMKRRKTDAGFFGSARFLAAGSMGSGNAMKPLSQDSIHPAYNGKKALLEDSAAQMKAGKVYIMLGINDIAPYGVQGAADNLEKLTLRIQQKLPEAHFFIQSATPMLAEKQKKTLNNENLERYNQLLESICQEQGWTYLNVAPELRGTDGALRREYCSDPDDLGLHFTDTACDVWIDYILTHTGGITP